MDNAFLLGGLVGFAPALFLFWFSMRKYDYPYVQGALFDSRKLFFTLAIGMVFGTFLFTFERFLYPYFIFEGGVDFALFLLIFVLAFPILEDLAKYVVLNFKGYEGRFDSVFYGISFGAGYAAVAMLGFVMLELNTAEQGGITPGAMNWIALFVLSASMSLIHCSVGGIIGHGTGKKMGLRILPQALVPHIVFNLLMFPWFLYNNIWFSLVFLLPVSAVIFTGVYSRTIPESLPDGVRKEMRRAERREVRHKKDK